MLIGSLNGEADGFSLHVLIFFKGNTMDHGTTRTTLERETFFFKLKFI